MAYRPEHLSAADAAAGTGVRRRWWLLACLVVLALVAVAARYCRPIPQFRSLSSSPDPSLHGTVAIVRGNCVDVVTASGSTHRTLSCWPRSWAISEVGWDKEDGSKVVVYNHEKPGSFQPDITLEREIRVIDPITGETGIIATQGGLSPGSSTIIPGEVDHGGSSSTPGTIISPNIEPRPTPNGEWDSTDDTWKATAPDGSVAVADKRTATITVTPAGGAAPVQLSVAGPPSYNFDRVAWSADQRWLLMCDSLHRLLVMPVDGSEVRELAVGALDAAYTDTEFPNLAPAKGP